MVVEMTDIMKERFESLLAKRALSRLPQIVWGQDCIDVKEALTFHQDWLLQDFSESEKEKVLHYMGILANGFKLKPQILAQLPIYKWTLPLGSKGIFQEVEAQYDFSYQLAVREMEECAERVLINFGDYRQNFFEQETTNKLYRKILIQKINEYNQAYGLPTNIGGGRMFWFKDRARIEYALTSAEDVLVASKGMDFSSRISNAENQFDFVLDCAFRMFIFHCNSYFSGMTYATLGRKSTNIKTFISAKTVEQMKRMVYKCGFLMDTLPMYSEREYYTVGRPSPYDVPVYVTLHKVKYSHLSEVDEELNTRFRKLCEKIEQLA